MKISRIYRKLWDGIAKRKREGRGCEGGVDGGRVVGCKRLWFPWQ